jgi:hypothetical protein
MPARSRPCKGMKGIVEEGSEMLQEDLEAGLLDAAITGAARKVEHYEMMAYESVMSMAKQLGQQEAAQLLQETLREEMEADRTLAQISKRILKEAQTNARGAAESEDEGETGSSRRSGRSGRSQSSSRSSSKRGGSSSRGRSSKSGASSHSAEPLVDHNEIQQWAEQRGAVPTCVRGTGGRGDTGMIRLEFPGFGSEEKLQEISWDDWFEKFDANNLALLVQETTAEGEQSNFNKLVKRGNAKAKPKARAAR